jgi:hypothetical protein
VERDLGTVTNSSSDFSLCSRLRRQSSVTNPVLGVKMRSNLSQQDGFAALGRTTAISGRR